MHRKASRESPGLESFNFLPRAESRRFFFSQVRPYFVFFTFSSRRSIFNRVPDKPIAEPHYRKRGQSPRRKPVWAMRPNGSTTQSLT